MYCTPGHAWAWRQIQYWIMAKLSRKERLPKMVRKRFIALLSRHGESNDALGTRGYETITMQNDSLCGPICLASYLLSKVSFFKKLEFWKQAFIIRYWYFFTKIVQTYCEKNCTSDREKLLKFEAEGREFAKFLSSLEQFIQTMQGQNNFW